MDSQKEGVMERDKQIERMTGAEHRASAFLDRGLSNPVARAILDRGNPERHKARRTAETQPQRKACG